MLTVCRHVSTLWNRRHLDWKIPAVEIFSSQYFLKLFSQPGSNIFLQKTHFKLVFLHSPRSVITICRDSLAPPFLVDILTNVKASNLWHIAFLVPRLPLHKGECKIYSILRLSSVYLDEYWIIFFWGDWKLPQPSPSGVVM